MDDKDDEMLGEVLWILYLKVGFIRTLLYQLYPLIPYFEDPNQNIVSHIKGSPLER